jgi:hypothetical protein
METRFAQVGVDEQHLAAELRHHHRQVGRRGSFPLA